MPIDTTSPLVAGLGVDIVEIERMQRVIDRSPRFTSRVFTEREQEYCDSKHMPAVHYATHFAAKEAVLKALGTGFSNGVGFTDVEVVHDAGGRPYPELRGRAADIAASMDILEIHLSLTRTHETAVANAIAVNAEARPAPAKEKATVKEELAQAFKDLRGMLDDLELAEEEASGSERGQMGKTEFDAALEGVDDHDVMDMLISEFSIAEA